MRTLRFLLATTILLLLLQIASIPVFASAGATDCPSTPNGISVSKPKIYDVDSLKQMLAATERNLATLSMLKGATIDAGVGKISGVTRNAVSTNIQATELAPPTDGKKDRTLGVGGAAVEPVAIEAIDLPTPTLAARDILAEQLQLMSQIAVLRLALESSISDRLGTDKDGKVITRRQVLLGFDVTLGNPEKFRNSVAEIILQIDSSAALANYKNSANCDVKNWVDASEPSVDQLSLVTVLPPKDSYNVATILQDINKVGLGMVTGTFQIGVGAQGEKESYFVAQDADLVAFSLPAESGGLLRFGWQIRPAFDRSTIEPGPRTLFALVALPADSGPFNGIPLKVSATTLWRKWNRESGFWLWRRPDRTVGDPRGESCLSAYKDVAFLVRESDELLEVFEPKVEVVTWGELADDRILVSVLGAGFEEGTKVTVGKSVLSTSSGLEVESTQHFKFVTPLSELVSGQDPQVLGVKGHQVPLISVLPPNSMPDLEDCNATPPAIGPDGKLELCVKNASLASGNLLAIVNGAIYRTSSPARHLGIVPDCDPPKPSCVGNAKLTLEVPADKVRETTKVQLRRLFTSPNTKILEIAIKNDFQVVSKVSFLGLENNEAVLAVEGRGFNANSQFLVGTTPVSWTAGGGNSDKFFLLKSKSIFARPGNKMVAHRNGESPQVIEIDKTAKAVPPKFAATPLVVKQGTNRVLEVVVENSASIVKILFEKADVLFSPIEGGNKIAIQITRAISEKVGELEFEVLIKDGEAIKLPFKVEA